jgi:hypothetical protein
MQASDTIPSLNSRQRAWLQEQQRFIHSGLNARQFCLEQQLNVATFYNRRQRLKELGLMSALTADSSSARFIDAGSIHAFAATEPSAAAKSADRDLSAGIELRIDLGAGVVLTLTRH